MAQRLTIRMNRADSGMSWGFRLHGGMEYGLPLTILTIVRNSICDRCGLKPRDRVVTINNMNVDGATHEMTKMEIIRSGLEMDLVVYRDPPGTTPVNTSKPAQPPTGVPKTKSNGYLQGYGPVLAPTSEPSPQSSAATAPAPAPEPGAPAPSTETDASAASATETPAPEPEQAPAQEVAPAPSEIKTEDAALVAPLTVDTSKDNLPPDTEVLSPKEVLASPAFKEMSTRGPKPFSPGGVKKAIPNVTHAQYNSPMGLYSADNIASVYAAQTEGIEREMEGLDVSKAPLGQKMSGTLQVID